MFTLMLTLLGLGLSLTHAFPSQAPEAGKNWVVIVAGSNGWDNYRHQADACHAYQIVHKNGIPDEQIVVMMFDDLATNEHNPTPGVLINRPNGNDVYNGVPKDYTGDAVTPENFLAVLKGDSASIKGGSGKVLESGPNDHVFVYFSDHGGPGILAFPNDELHVKDFQDTIKFMRDNKKYQKMVLYIEACYSGSMMTDLSDDIDVYATTATNSAESSYACYYDEWRETFLGDWYSINWMEQSDVEDLTKVTLAEQFQTVKNKTYRSHVQQFGSQTLAHMKLMAFQGNSGTNSMAPRMTLEPVANLDLTPGPDVPLYILKRKKMASNDFIFNSYSLPLSAQRQIKEELADRMRRVVETVTGDSSQTQVVLNSWSALTQHTCYQSAVRHFKTTCFNWNKFKYEYVIRHLYALVNLCERGYATDRILQAMDDACYFSFLADVALQFLAGISE